MSKISIEKAKNYLALKRSSLHQKVRWLKGSSAVVN